MNPRPLPWLRLYVEMVDDEKVRLLAFEDRWHYVALLCCKGAGLLDSGDKPELLRRKLGVKLGLAPRELEAAAARLAEVGLVDADSFQPLGWESRQMRSDSSRDRVAAYRERQKQDRNVTDTAQETDSDTEQETEKRKGRRGTRLPPDWQPDVELLAFAASRGWGGERLTDELDSFRDYWHAAPGAKGVKLDWSATFRNWIRKARGPYERPHTTGGSRRESEAERVERINREHDQREGYAIGH